jgi:hypothetical protein
MARIAPLQKQGQEQPTNLIRVDFRRSTGQDGQILDQQVSQTIVRLRGYSQRGEPIPPNFGQILREIEKSQHLLELEHDWDGEGSPGYEKQTWDRATTFLSHNIILLWQLYHVCVDVPRISPGPDGSIDIHWKSKSPELLINIPSDLSEPADYYGDNKLGQIVKGVLDTSVKNLWLLMWLMQ